MIAATLAIERSLRSYGNTSDHKDRPDRRPTFWRAIGIGTIEAIIWKPGLSERKLFLFICCEMFQAQAKRMQHVACKIVGSCCNMLSRVGQKNATCIGMCNMVAKRTQLRATMLHDVAPTCCIRVWPGASCIFKYSHVAVDSVAHFVRPFNGSLPEIRYSQRFGVLARMVLRMCIEIVFSIAKTIEKDHYHMSRATSGKIAHFDWLFCRAIFSCNARVLDYGKMTGKTSKRGRFESASWGKKNTQQTDTTDEYIRR